MNLKQGEIVNVNLSPTSGHEQNGERPVLILSSVKVPNISNMYIVAPISTTTRNYPFYHKLNSAPNTVGQVLLDQTRGLDLETRGYDPRYQNSVSKEELEIIINKYKLLFDID